MYYFFAVIQVYLLCETVKQTGWVTVRNTKYNKYYHNCLDFFHQDLKENVLYRVCDLLDYQEDFTAFVHRLGYCLLIVYLLTLFVYSRLNVHMPAAGQAQVLGARCGLCAGSVLPFDPGSRDSPAALYPLGQTGPDQYLCRIGGTLDDLGLWHLPDAPVLYDST